MKGKYLANDSLNPDSSAFFFSKSHIYPYPMKLVLAKRSNRLQAFDALGAGASELPSCLWNVSLWKGSCPERSESVRIPQFSQFFRLVQRNDGGELRHWLLDPPNSFAEWPFLSRTNVAQTRFPTSQTVRTIAYYGQVASHQAHEAADQGLVEGTEFLPICLSCKSLTIQAMARFEKSQTLQEVLTHYKRVNVASLSAACRLAKTWATGFVGKIYGWNRLKGWFCHHV